IAQGDCLEDMKRIPNGSVDMILADLPYGTTACAWDLIIPFEPLWVQYNRIIKYNGAIVLTASQPFTTKLIQSNFDNLKHLWYWNKENGGKYTISKYNTQRLVKEVVVFRKDNRRVKYYQIMEEVERDKIRAIRRPRKMRESNPQRIASGVIQVSETYSNK